jgi:hypothetical protein
VAAVEASGLVVDRATYAFMSVFPFFALDRVSQRIRVRAARIDSALGDVPALPTVSPFVRRLLMSLCGVDRRLLASHDLPLGSSVLVAASKP